jgi:hypothetical protein
MQFADFRPESESITPELIALLGQVEAHPQYAALLAKLPALAEVIEGIAHCAHSMRPDVTADEVVRYLNSLEVVRAVKVSASVRRPRP